VTNPKLAFIALILAVFSASRAQAQVTIDVSKITCRQFILYEVTKPEYIAIWIHGYYSGKHDSTLVEVQQLKANADRVEKYCREHLDETVMRAAATLLDADKSDKSKLSGR
jgi:acid stress chaperone HdeB